MRKVAAEQKQSTVSKKRLTIFVLK